jgi:hypothetical protein
MLGPLFVLVCLALLPDTAFAEPAATRPGGPRVRAHDSRMAGLIADGLRRSPTLRSLVDRIEASNVIVYVGGNPLMKKHLSGALSFVTTAGNFRYVRATINADQLNDVMISTLAHEFQHVVEVIDEPSVVDDDSLVRLYRRIGVSNNERRTTGWETLAAQAMGAQVRRELILGRANAVTNLASATLPNERL